MLIDGVHRVAGIEGGTYRVVIEAMGFAPYERAGVVVPETGDTDLGTIEFPLGSTVRVRFPARAASETDAPRTVWCNATPIESLTNRQGRHAQAQLKGGDVIDITGLGAGRWKISVASQAPRNNAMETLLNQDVEVDGVRDLVLDVPGP